MTRASLPALPQRPLDCLIELCEGFSLSFALNEFDEVKLAWIEAGW
jgi:hypothetical protein